MRSRQASYHPHTTLDLGDYSCRPESERNNPKNIYNRPPEKPSKLKIDHLTYFNNTIFITKYSYGHTRGYHTNTPTQPRSQTPGPRTGVWHPSSKFEPTTKRTQRHPPEFQPRLNSFQKITNSANNNSIQIRDLSGASRLATMQAQFKRAEMSGIRSCIHTMHDACERVDCGNSWTGFCQLRLIIYICRRST